MRNGQRRPRVEFLRARLERRTFLHMVWMHVYRRDLIESKSMRFVAPFVHEDVPWTTRMLLATSA
jgi:heptose III glucuronosyltransferase